MEINEAIKKAKAVIFDLDGTIVDSMWMWKQIDIDYLGMINRPFPTDLQKCIEGMSFYETAVYFKNQFNIEDDVEDIMKCWNDMAYDKYTYDVPLKPGFDGFIKYLSNNGYKLGVATSNSRVLAYASLESRNVKQYFDSVITGDECGRGKPEPDVFLNTAKALGVEPKDCIVFEDLPAGITAGKRAGMKTVAIADEYSSYLWDIKKEMADYYIEDYREIMDEIHNA